MKISREKKIEKTLTGFRFAKKKFTLEKNFCFHRKFQILKGYDIATVSLSVTTRLVENCDDFPPTASHSHKHIFPKVEFF